MGPIVCRLQLDTSEEFHSAFTLLTPKAREKTKVSPWNPAGSTLASESIDSIHGCHGFLLHVSV